MLRFARSRRMVAALATATLCVILAATPVTATEVYRNVSYLYTQDQSTWYGMATLDRWFSSSPPAPIKTTLKVDVTDLKPSRYYYAKIYGGECWSEGYLIASIKVKSGTSGKILKTMLLTASQRRGVQRAYDRGIPLMVLFVGSGLQLCGPVE
jgi:hypothetical protein